MPFKAPEPPVQVAARIAASPAPVILLDTCSVLDVIRAGSRRDIRPQLVESANGMILSAQSDPKRLWLVAFQLVLSEWAKNSQRESDAVVSGILKINSEIAAYRITAQNAMPLVQIPHFQLDAATFPAQLLLLSETLLLESEIIAEDDALLALSMRRVLNDHAPSSKGQEAKDCVIVEHYLALAAELRRLGVHAPVIFVSSNVKDYGVPNAPLPPLNTQFPNVQVQFALNLTAALAAI